MTTGQAIWRIFKTLFFLTAFIIALVACKGRPATIFQWVAVVGNFIGFVSQLLKD